MDKIIYKFDTICKHQSSGNTAKQHFILQNIEKRRLTDIYHSHDFYEFIIMLRGSCTAFINKGEYTLVKDDVVCMSPEDSHNFSGQSEDLHILSFSVKSSEVAEACKYIGKTTEECFGFKAHPLIFQEPQLQSALRFIYTDINDNALVYEYKFLLSYLMKSLAVKAENGDKDECPRAIAAALKEMKKRENLKKGVDALAEIAGYSRPHMLRLMKKYFNMTMHEYISEQRLETAYNDLVLTNSRPEDIAEELGYKSFSHFSKKFKKKYMITPAELRKQNGAWTI